MQLFARTLVVHVRHTFFAYVLVATNQWQQRRLVTAHDARYLTRIAIITFTLIISTKSIILLLYPLIIIVSANNRVVCIFVIFRDRYRREGRGGGGGGGGDNRC